MAPGCGSFFRKTTTNFENFCEKVAKKLDFIPVVCYNNIKIPCKTICRLYRSLKGGFLTGFQFPKREPRRRGFPDG